MVARRNAGFALLEITIGLALLASAVVGIAQLFSIAGRASRLARTDGLAAVLAAQKMEQLRGLAWGYGVNGESCTDASTDVAQYPEAGGGRGLLPSPPSTLIANVPGFVDFLDGDGAWIGAGETPTPGAVFVRRWSIEALPDSPADTLVLRVVVAWLGPALRERGSVPLGPGTLVLTSVRSRRAR